MVRCQNDVITTTQYGFIRPNLSINTPSMTQLEPLHIIAPQLS